MDLENDKRKGKYRKAESSETLLSDFNDLISDFKVDLKEAKSDLPLIFVVGLPRSGTTLLMQCLAQSFDIGFVNNIVARFWSNPLLGFLLSQLAGSSYKSDFTNDFGKTNDAYAPHEFSYFWNKNFKVTRYQSYLAEVNSKIIEWPSIFDTIKKMQAAHGKGFLFKAMHQGRHLSEFYESFPNLFVIYIKRDPIEVSHSVLKARRNYYSDPNEWWSLFSRNYKEIKSKPYHEQIPLQLESLNNEFDTNFAQLPEANKILVEFTDLIRTPSNVILDIANKIEELSGVDILLEDRISLMPKSFESSKSKSFELDDLLYNESLKYFRR